MELYLSIAPNKLFDQLNDFAYKNNLLFFNPNAKEIKNKLSETDFQNEILINFWIVESNFSPPLNMDYVYETEQYGVGIRLIRSKDKINTTLFSWFPTRSLMGKRIGNLLKKYIDKHNNKGMITDNPIWKNTKKESDLTKYYWNDSVLNQKLPLYDFLGGTEIKPNSHSKL